jgi:biliverdin reductase
LAVGKHFYHLHRRKNAGFYSESCQLMQGKNRRTIKVGTRRGLFAIDTDMVLKYLSKCTHFYVKNARSL